MAKTRSKGSASPVVDKVQRSSKVTKPQKAAKKVEVKAPSSEVTTTDVPSSVVIPEKVSRKALSELTKFLLREGSKSTLSDRKSQLFEDDDTSDRTAYLTIESKKFFSGKPQFKPKTIKLTKPIYNESDVKTCLIVRDEIVKSNGDIEKIEEASLNTLENILPVSVIKTNYKSFESRRQLYSEYDLFLVDDAVLNSMPKLLGKVFYKTNKIPIPIRVTTSSNNKELSLQTLKNQLEKCLHSTHYLPPQGTIISIKIGYISGDDDGEKDAPVFSKEDLVKNINDVVSAFDIDTVKTIMLKTVTSPALPLFYTDKLYDEDLDVLKETPSDKEVEKTSKGESAFEKTLLELADAQTVGKVLGKKLRDDKKKKKSKSIKKSSTKSIKDKVQQSE
ncbi:CIC1 [Candida oxycetoniae]|uniref:CIC1 n=1 Tax=Candida oxycetoniae TaxID=497107 RepID=A0AAI9SY05_9ASCO|nr:CIC1 [Candida oxycetoniae]KAI3405177.2 CIC1 [Candida oxycetoniae]